MIATNTPFYKELQKEVEEYKEGDSKMSRCAWNLIITKRDLTLWTELKMKPHRHWKVSDVKKYFGITGTGEGLMRNFMVLYNTVMGEE